MTGETGWGLGPLGRRLLVAFVLVALSSVLVLTVAALVGTARGISAGEDAAREAAATATAAAAAAAYRDAGGWPGADLAPADEVAAAAGARLVVRDEAGVIVREPGGGGTGQGGGGSAGRGGATTAVVVDGATVGSVRLAFGTPASGAAQQIAWTWILVAAAVSLVVAVVVAWVVSRRISSPLVRLSDVALAFAAGDRTVRAAPGDVRAPGELGDLARAFDSTADEVVKAEQTRQRMAADLAHELRTPLAALQAGLEELSDGWVAPDPDRLAALHAQSVRLGRVVADLGALTDAEAAAVSLRRAPVDLGVLVVQAAAAARPSLEAAGLTLAVGPVDPVVVLGDDDRLHQAVGNLLLNTARHCRAGDAVTVGVSAVAGVAVVTVSDTGPGIAAGDQPFVFDRLWRGSADVGPEGSGIGLAVVRELVTAHGGTVQVQSDGATGTTFTVRLPAAPAADVS